VNAGIPENKEGYFKVDLDSTTLYIHNDLAEWSIEIFWSSYAGIGKLSARQY